LNMLHAMMREMPDVERIGEIIEIRQLVRNLELFRGFGHLDTSKACLPVDSKCHQYSGYTGVWQAMIQRRITNAVSMTEIENGYRSRRSALP
jgi:hypothetical protein